MKHGVLWLLGFMIALMAVLARATSPIPYVSCDSSSLDSRRVPDDIRSIATRMKGSLIRFCIDTRSGEPFSFNVQMPAVHDPIGVCAYQVRNFRRQDAGSAKDWTSIDTGGRSNSSIFMRVSKTCDGSDGFTLGIDVSTGSFMRISNLWNKLFSKESMDKFLARAGAEQELKELIVSLRARARSGIPLDLRFIALESPSERPFPYFRIGFPDTSVFLMVDFEGEELVLLGWGWQS